MMTNVTNLFVRKELREYTENKSAVLSFPEDFLMANKDCPNDFSEKRRMEIHGSLSPSDGSGQVQNAFVLRFLILWKKSHFLFLLHVKKKCPFSL